MGVAILILNAALNMIKKMKKTTMSVAILAVSAAAILGALLLSWRLSSIVVMVVAGMVSLALFLRKERAGK